MAMKLREKLFGAKKKEDPQVLMRIAKVIGPLIDNATTDLFRRFGEKLVLAPITYIVPAVWGASKTGPITAEQKAIHALIDPVIKQTVQAMGLSRIDGAQRFAIEYLIRGLIISKILYMLEMFQKQKALKRCADAPLGDALRKMDPIGSA